MGNQNKTVQCPQCYSYIGEDSRYCHKCGYLVEEDQKTLTYSPAQEKLADDSLHFLPGESFGPRYRIIEEIGRGGMGRVYKAEDQELGITVALKMIRPEFSSRPSFIQQFKEETLLARAISHENVIRIHDISEVNDIKFISMDFIKGHNLKELIHTSGTLAVETAINITKQLCKGLSVAHKKGIVHQDLKPRNIMIDNDGRVYTMDFGVAKSVAAQEMTPSKGIIGTPPYISPEQAKKEKVDQRSDIYSFGIIIYEMLTGKRPFEAETSSEYVEKHIHETPPSPSKTNPLIPPFLEKIILKCLEKDRDKRYQSVNEILKDLEEHKEESKIILARPKAKKLWRFVYAIPLILIIGIGIYLLIGKRKTIVPSAARGGRIPLAVMYFENNTGDERLDYWRKALSDLIIIDLAQSRLISVVTGNRLLEILENLHLLEAKNYTTEDLKEVASRGGVDYILHGNYTKAEETFRINVMLQNIVTEELTGSKSVKGKGLESFDTMVDELTPWIKSQFNLTRQEIAEDIDRKIGKIFTSSPEALELYYQAKQHYHEGKFEKSIEVLKKALAVDPGFAIAYKIISENFHYIGEIEQAYQYAQGALSLIDRISFRERSLIQGWAYTVLENSYDEAIETYRKMLKYYPDDEDGNVYLGAIYRNMEEWDLALERFSKILNVNPLIACKNLVLLYMAKGSYDKAKEILQSYRDVYEEDDFHWDLSLIYLCQGRDDLALIEAENAFSLNREDESNIELMGDIYHIQDNFRGAEYYYRQLLEKEDLFSQLNGRHWLGRLYLAQGQYEKCKQEINQGITESEKHNKIFDMLRFLKFSAYLNLRMNQLDEALDSLDQIERIAPKFGETSGVILALHYRGLIYLEMKKTNEAKKIAEQLEQLIKETGIKKYMRYYYHLKGMIAQTNNNASQTIKAFEKALTFLAHQREVDDEHAFFSYALASFYYQIGNFEKAQKQYGKIINLTTGRLYWGDIYARSFFWVGKIFQKKGEQEKAIENYEKFLQLWKATDLGLPEIAEAKNQLALLKKALKE